MRTLLILVASLASAADFTTALSDAYPYTISAIATDAADYTYVVGSRQIGAPTIAYISSTPPTIQNLSGTDVFVSKLDPSGKLLFTDTFAGKGSDQGLAIALDPSGNIYIAGSTTSSDFPLSKALQTQASSTGTGFIMKLSNDGSTILYSTYFGGTQGSTAISALATDAKGNIYLTGATTATDFPHTAGMPWSPILATDTGVFFASISAAGDKILYAGAVVSGPIPIPGGTTSPNAAGVAVDALGNAYFAGTLGGGSSLPTTAGVLMPTGQYTGFAMKLSPTGVSYATYLPWPVSAMALDGSGDLYLGVSPPRGNSSVSKLNSGATAILWSDSLPAQSVNSIAVDAAGNAWVGGTGAVTTFPNQGWSSGTDYLGEVNVPNNTVYSATYPNGTVAQAVSVDPSGLLHAAGSNGFVSTINPGLPEAPRIFGFQNAFGGNITARLAPGEVISIYGPGIGPVTPVTATPANGFYPKTLAGIQVTFNGVAAPLLYAGPNQINAVVPMGVTVKTAAIVQVGSGPAYPVWIDAGEAMAYPVVLNQDGSVNSYLNPAIFSSVVSVYATGWQSSFPGLADGQIATTAAFDCPACTATVITSGFPWSPFVVYSGAAPGIVAGVSQINLNVNYADGAIDGTYTYVITNLNTSFTVRVNVAP
jgi:uncharacterized protein (TIGR03437 family)